MLLAEPKATLFVSDDNMASPTDFMNQVAGGYQNALAGPPAKTCPTCGKPIEDDVPEPIPSAAAQVQKGATQGELPPSVLWDNLQKGLSGS